MKVLVTAGCVYGRLDDNKLIVGNRSRGIWAMKFAQHLATKGHHVTLLVPDTTTRVMIQQYTGKNGHHPGSIWILKQHGFKDYHTKCRELAKTHDAAVLAAAVVNWIPANPIKGKMETKGYTTGDVINISFVLAPRVIEDMKKANPMLTLIGCKMLIGATEDELVDAAYGVLLKSRCNVVIANDMKHGLKRKLLIYKDRSVHEYDNDFEGFYAALTAVIEDEHWVTVFHVDDPPEDSTEAEILFDRLVDEHRSRFMPVEGDRVFGALAVKIDLGGADHWLVSPREKGGLFTSADASYVEAVLTSDEIVFAFRAKASLNAPLLIRFATQFRHNAVLHFHEQVESLPTLPYAPPGTVRDNNRKIPVECENGFNIVGHGCVIPA